MFGVGLTLPKVSAVLLNAIGGLLAAYKINDLTPDLVADFNGSLNTGTEFYDAGGTVDTFAELITHSRAGNATMTDGYGPELVTNGDFSTDSDWTKGTGWSIADGVASSDGSQSSSSALQAVDILTIGTTYEVTFTVVSRAAGSITARLGTNGVGTTRTATGTYIELITCAGTDDVRMTASNDFVGSIDNVSVREMPAIKWAPHNLLPYSEEFNSWTENAGISVDSDVETAPDGTSTADVLTQPANSFGYLSIGNSAPGAGGAYTYTMAVWAKRISGQGSLKVHGEIGYSVTVNPTSEWQLFVLENYLPVIAVRTRIYVDSRDGDQSETSIAVWGAHLYRSDLGGMVDNPDRGDSYVPTTSSAVYLPRRNHHVYNGDAWVNEGVLHESEARTNLVTYSQDFTDSSWVKGNTATLALDSVGPDGQANSAVKLIDSNDSGTGSVIAYTNLTLATTTAHTFSCYLKADQLSWGYLRVAGYATLPNGGAFFDLSSGTVGTVEDAAYSATIQDVGNGWYRCALSFTTEADGTGRLDIFVAQDDLDPNVARDGTSSILIYGAQVEEGSTPSSLIPTNGATVSRALETLTIPASNMPWPEPNVIGSELVTNGTFDTDVSGWSTFNAVISQENQALRITSGNASGNQSAYQVVSGLTVGAVYVASLEVLEHTGGQTFRVGDGVAQSQYGYSSTNTLGVHQLIFTAQTASVYITSLIFDNVGDGRSFLVDNISVREIDPLAVSIQMQGRMTYADTGSTSEANPYYWSLNGTNLILTDLYTLTDPDRLRFRQAASGVFDFVQDTSGNTFSPGILVPYNIASRNGSTFINGAVDGTALTADTTPTALPDLSATDFNLGYDYMGTISMLRVWADDLADVGIAEATEPSEVPSLQLTFDNSETSFNIQDWEQ